MSTAPGNSYYKQKLKILLSNGDTINDLIPSMESIPLNATKLFLHQKIDELDVNSARHAYYRASPIHEIFSDDLCQYLLLFAGLYNVKAVCKKWKYLSDRNEEIYINQLYQSMTASTEIGMKYDENINKTWIVHEFRQSLNKIEIGLGFKGPVNTVYEALKECKNGDRILVFSGTYINYHTDAVNKNVRIIGVESDVILKHITNDESRILTVGRSAYFENISIELIQTNDALDSLEETLIYIETNCYLYIKNCKFRYRQTGILLRDGAKLDAINCQFVGGSIGIEISPIAKSVNINNCLFRNNGQLTGEEASVITPADEYGCIQIFDDYGDIAPSNSYNQDSDDSQLQLFVQLKCIGNTFQDNLCYPIVERSNGDYLLRNTDTYLLKDNKLKGYNGTYTTQKDNIEDANTLYHSQFG